VRVGFTPVDLSKVDKEEREQARLDENRSQRVRLILAMVFALPCFMWRWGTWSGCLCPANSPRTQPLSVCIIAVDADFTDCSGRARFFCNRHKSRNAAQTEHGLIDCHGLSRGACLQSVILVHIFFDPEHALI
jgi:hypothetical protein